MMRADKMDTRTRIVMRFIVPGDASTSKVAAHRYEVFGRS